MEKTKRGWVDAEVEVELRWERIKHGGGSACDCRMVAAGGKRSWSTTVRCLPELGVL